MKKKLVFLTGAGISKESGIDTFRDSDGTWEQFRIEDVATIEAWRDKSKRPGMIDFYNKRRAQLDTVEPNTAHMAIAGLEEEYDVTVITQNVDDLHERAGTSNVVHLHGELRKLCSSNDTSKTLPWEEPIELGQKHPDGSHIRPYIVWFGEQVPMMEKACEIVYSADIVVIVGTSLQVYPAASLAHYRGINTPIYVIDPGDMNINLEDDDSITHIKKTATQGMQDFITYLRGS